MSYFGVGLRNAVSLGLGGVISLKSNVTGASPPDPGPPWIVLNSTGTDYICTNQVLASTGVIYSVVSPVLSSTGTSYNPI